MRRWATTGIGFGVVTVLIAGCSSATQPAPRESKSKSTATSSTAPLRIAPTTTTTPVAPTTTTSTLPPATLDTVTIGGWTGAEPDIIYFSGDSGNIVSNITWSSWSSESALGHGMWNYDDCVPNCAQGTVTQYPTTIMLSIPVDGQFTSLTEDQAGPHGNTYSYTLPDRGLGGAS